MKTNFARPGYISPVTSSPGDEWKRLELQDKGTQHLLKAPLINSLQVCSLTCYSQAANSVIKPQNPGTQAPTKQTALFAGRYGKHRTSLLPGMFGLTANPSTGPPNLHWRTNTHPCSYKSQGPPQREFGWLLNHTSLVSLQICGYSITLHFNSVPVNRAAY